MDKRLLIGGLFLFLLLLSIVLTSGTPINCADSASYTNCATYGCFRIVNSSGNTVAIIDGGGFIDINAMYYPSYNMTGWTPSTPTFFINNVSGGHVAGFPSNGNFVFGGTVSDDNNAAYCTAPAGSFIIKNSAGNCVAYISSVGNVWLRGRLCYYATSTG